MYDIMNCVCLSCCKFSPRAKRLLTSASESKDLKELNPCPCQKYGDVDFARGNHYIKDPSIKSEKSDQV